jgi:hypothetical protein
VHLGVHPDSSGAEPLRLSGTRLHDALTNRRGRFRLGRMRQVGNRQRRHIDNQVDAIAQRTGDPVPIALDLEGRAAAESDRVTQEAAGTSLRCLVAMSTSEDRNRSRQRIRGSSGRSATTSGSAG